MSQETQDAVVTLAQNLDQVEPLKAYVEQMAGESGNNIHYYAALVSANTVMEERENLVDRLQDTEPSAFVYAFLKYFLNEIFLCCKFHSFIFGNAS